MSQRTRNRTPQKAEEWKPAWLEAFSRLGMVMAACKDVGVGRTTVYEARQQDEAFAVAWADVEQATTERMEREAYRRAVEGVRKDIFYRDQVIGEERSYSDTLLIFMLKARRPDVYRENVKVEHSGKVGHDLSTLPAEELEAIVSGLSGKRA